MQSVLPKLLSQLKIQMPGLKTVLTEGTNKLLFEKLLHRELDFGFVPNATPPKEFNSEVIYKENFVLILPAKHRLSKKTFTSLADCADEDWVLPPQKEGFGYVEIVYRIFQNHGFLPKVVHESPNASSVLRLVEAGLGLNIMGKSALTGVQLDIKHIELTDIPEKIEMRLVWLKEREPELKKTIEIFSKYLKAK
jgi:DNA-binding transcriptional LysR family regulator